MFLNTSLHTVSNQQVTCAVQFFTNTEHGYLEVKRNQND